MERTPERQGAALSAATEAPQTEGQARPGVPAGMADATVRRMAASEAPPMLLVEGAGGVLLATHRTQLDGRDWTLPPGTYLVIESVDGDQLRCRTYSNHGGRISIIPRALFRPEPRVNQRKEEDQDDPDAPRDPDATSYMEHLGPLWNERPKPEDVYQGAIGDCYLMSAAAALAGSDPAAIMRAFSPHKGRQRTYRVTLYETRGNDTFVPKVFTVDTFLPTTRKPSGPAGAERYVAAYGGKGRRTEDFEQPLWPSLLEKAYAELMSHGYDAVGQGGFEKEAFQAITGRPALSANLGSLGGDDAGFLKELRNLLASGRAVTAGTVGSLTVAEEAGFELRDGAYRAKLRAGGAGEPTRDDIPASIAKGSVFISDVRGQAPVAKDNQRGALVGDGVKGTIAYSKQEASLWFDDGRAPASPADLRATYDWRGLIDPTLGVVAGHAYVFEQVTPEGLLVLKNPWGRRHPQPLTLAQFRRLFAEITIDHLTDEERAASQ